MDANVYTTGSNVWFKCLLTNAVNHVPSMLSGVLYVELISADETILETKLIKIDNGIGQGFFFLNENMPGGLYLIRAYTQWNKNFGTDFVFQEYIRVFVSDENKEEPIEIVRLTKKPNKELFLEAYFNPHVIDSLQKNKLNVFISLENIIDSLSIRRGKNNKYWFECLIPDSFQVATLKMQTSNNLKYSKAIVLNKDYIDLQFFPESGELVHGLQSKVGFKALSANGEGKIVQGDIVNEQDSIIVTFNSNSLGMGSFVLNEVDSAKNYFAKLRQTTNEIDKIMYALPDISPMGNVLSVKRKEDSVLLNCMSNYLKNDSIYLQISCRGIFYYEIPASLKNGIFRDFIPINSLPEGIIVFKMLNKWMQPVAERLYYNEVPVNRLNITLSTDTDNYQKRNKTGLNIQTTNSQGQPTQANLSILVINKKLKGKMQSYRQNILSYFLLDSELKGDIENPGFYFSKDSLKHDYLDALMLTQGWRKYNYSRPLGKFNFQNEPSLSVSGKVSNPFSKNRIKKVGFVKMKYDNNILTYSEITDSLGRFNFYLEDLYGKDIDISIQSTDVSGKETNHIVTLDKKGLPHISFNHMKMAEKLDSFVYSFVEKDIKRNEIDKAFQLSAWDILLEEVEIKSFRLTPERKMVTEKFGKPNDIIGGKELQSKEDKWTRGIYDLLDYYYADKIRITENSYGEMSAKVWGSDITLVIIDGIPVKFCYGEYSFIQHIPPSEVVSLEIIEQPKNWYDLYYEANNTSPPPGAATCSIIAIYTKANKGIYGAYIPRGLTRAIMPVFSESKEFYSSRYENSNYKNSRIPDLRTLIHWQPILETDSLGNAMTTFYNSDIPGEMRVVVEAITEKGEIGYQEIDYKVEGKEQKIIIIE
ncbi:MAG: hypothetical protein R6W78_17205 [Bacteroidales bacterium]